jgi:hypothetical protein
MATSWMDGFEDVGSANLSLWYTISGSYETVQASGRYGNCLRLGGAASYALRPFTTSATDVYVAVALKSALTGFSTSCYAFLWLGNADGGALGFAIGVDGTVQVLLFPGLWDSPSYRGMNPRADLCNVIATSDPGVVVADTWVHLEIHATLSDTTGVVEIRKSGDVVLDASSLDTKEASVSAWTYAQLHGIRSSSSAYIYFDDFCIGDSFYGDCRIDSHLPTADVQTDWTPSSGVDLYAMVDDADADGDTTTIHAHTATDKATFQVETLKNTGANPVGRLICWVGKKDAAGTSSVGSVLTHSGSDTDGTGQALSLSHAGYCGAAAGCSEADFNADRYGVQKTA